MKRDVPQMPFLKYERLENQFNHNKGDDLELELGPVILICLYFNWFWSSLIRFSYSLHNFLLYAVTAEHRQKKTLVNDDILNTQPWLN